MGKSWVCNGCYSILLACKRCSWYHPYCRGTSAGTGCKTTLFVTGKAQNIEYVVVVVGGGNQDRFILLCFIRSCWLKLMLVSFNFFKRLMFWYFKGSTLTFLVMKWICLSLIYLIKSLKSPQIIVMQEDDWNRSEKNTDAEHWSWPRNSTAIMLQLTSTFPVWELSLLISGVWLRVHPPLRRSINATPCTSDCTICFSQAHMFLSWHDCWSLSEETKWILLVNQVKQVFKHYDDDGFAAASSTIMPSGLMCSSGQTA